MPSPSRSTPSGGADWDRSMPPQMKKGRMNPYDVGLKTLVRAGPFPTNLRSLCLKKPAGLAEGECYHIFGQTHIARECETDTLCPAHCLVWMSCQGIWCGAVAWDWERRSFFPWDRVFCSANVTGNARYVKLLCIFDHNTHGPDVGAFSSERSKG